MPNSNAGSGERATVGRLRNVIYLIVTAACVIGLTGVNAYRAAVQSITHDEAVTYDRYVRGPLYRLVSSTDANNHILHSVLCRATVGVCGPSEFALRIPSLAGGLLLLVLVARVGWRVWGPSATTTAAVLLVGLNPFVMDYLSIARGYSLALAMWVAALDQLLAAWQARDSGTSAEGHVRRASQLLALSVLANLTFVIAALALAVCWAGWALLVRRQHVTETKRQAFTWLWLTLGRPGAIVFACLALPLVKLRPSHFYFGAESLSESLRSFVYASFAHHPQNWPWDNQSAGFQTGLDIIALIVVPSVVIAMLVLWVFVAHGLLRKAVDPSGRIEPGEALYFLSAGTLSLGIGMVVVLHGIVGLKFPIERTGLYLLLPSCLAILSASSALSASVRSSVGVVSAAILRGAVMVAGLLLCVAWGMQLQMDHYRTWAFERDSRLVFQQIVAQHHREPKQVLRVGATWVLVPALNFYRDVYHADYVERIERRDSYAADVDLYVVAAAESGGVPPSEPVIELYRGAASGTIVAAPTRRVSAARFETSAPID